MLLFYIICLGTLSTTQNVFCDLASLFIRLGLECSKRLENHWLRLEHTLQILNTFDLQDTSSNSCNVTVIL